MNENSKPCELVKDDVRILHVADIQVKNRELSLSKSYAKSLTNIENEIRLMNIQVYLIAGDLFEYATPNDSERKLIYNHLAKVASIPCVKEILLFAGNHDLVKEKKQFESQSENNPIDTFMSFIKGFDSTIAPDLLHKFIYLKKSGIYQSPNFNKLNYIVYSCEDNGVNDFGFINDEQIDPNKINICIFHDMIREYIDEKKLPIKKERYNALHGIADFASPLILAGDIHENWSGQDAMEENTFIYPGSSVQRNFGEGIYITSKTDAKLIPRYAMRVGINLDKPTASCFNIAHVALKDFVAYNTIIFDEGNLADPLAFLQEKMCQINYGEEQTFIKVVLSNLFLSHEQPIVNMLQTYSMDKKRVSIDVVYSKFINTAVGEKINELSGSLSEITSEDDLQLNEDKLKLLFTEVLTTALENNKKIIAEDGIDEEEISNKIKELFIEQLEVAMQDTSKYNIVLESIENNNFMGLGANRIQLDIPGLTRIIGTNGIGKTTLYHMVRWCVKGEVFEGMSKAQKIKNTYPIFNDKLYDVDLVLVKLTSIVNNTPIAITRTAERSWKNGTTDEQKKSKNWKRFVSGVNLNVKLEVFSEKNGNKTFTGDQAEMLINAWFGNVIDNIMILNQSKISSILNMPSLQLLELVLNYIGVDYLKKLEENIDTVKGTLNLQKPKEKKEELEEQLETAGLDLNINKIELKKINQELEEKGKVLIEQKEKLQQQQNELVEMGNIENQVIMVKNQLETIELDLKTEVNTVKKEFLSPDTAKEPVKPNTAEVEEAIAKCDAEITKIEAEVEASQNQYGNIFNSSIENLNDNIKANKEQLDTLSQQLSDADAVQKESYNKLTARIITIRDLLKNNADAIQQQVENITVDIAAIEKQIADNKSEIESGICFNCKKPLSDNFEQHKVELEAKQKAYEVELEEKKLALQEAKAKLDKFKTVIEKYNTYSNIASSGKLEGIEVTDAECLTTIDSIKQKAESIANLNDNANAAKEIQQQLNAKQQKYQNLYQIFSTKNDAVIEVHPGFSNDEGLQKALAEYFLIWRKLKALNVQLLDKKKSLKEDKEKLTKSNQDYLAAVEDYQKELKRISDENEKIKQYNESIDTIVKQRQEKQLLQAQKSKELVELNILLPEYKQKVEEAKELKDAQEANELTITKLQGRQKTAELEIQKLETAVEQHKKAWDNYISYLRDKLTFDIYSKLIKREFKDIVFGYYRNFLNSTLNILLEDMNFKLLWDEENDLYMIDFKNGSCSYRPVQQSSGMETCFLGLSLIYAIHMLNVKNTISSIFIDEISGQLNNGKNLSYKVQNYQEQLLLLLAKFTKKNIFIIDHVIDNLFETCTLEVQPTPQGSKYTII